MAVPVLVAARLARRSIVCLELGEFDLALVSTLVQHACEIYLTPIASYDLQRVHHCRLKQT